MLEEGAPLELGFPANLFSLSAKTVSATREVIFLLNCPYLVGLLGLELQDPPWDQGCHPCPGDPWVQEEPGWLLQLVFGLEHLGGRKSLWAGGRNGNVRWRLRRQPSFCLKITSFLPFLFVPTISTECHQNGSHHTLHNVLFTHRPSQWIGSSLMTRAKLYLSCLLGLSTGPGTCCKYGSLRLGLGLG